MVKKGVFGRTQRYVYVDEELSQQEEDVCSLNIKPTACASLADVCLSPLDGSCIHKRMYIWVHVLTVCVMVCSLSVCVCLTPGPSH